MNIDTSSVRVTRVLTLLVVLAGVVPALAAGGVAADAATAPADGVRAIYADSDGVITTVEPDGSVHSTGVTASVVGPMADLDGDGVLEAPFVDGSGTLRLVEPDGDTTTLAGSAAKSKTAIAVGDYDGDGTLAVYYSDPSDSGYVYRVEVGASPGSPERLTATAAKGVAGVADIDGDGADELVFAGSSSTVKYLDGGDLLSTGYSSIGSNNGFGLGPAADFDGDGTARVAVVDGSNNVGLVDASGSKATIAAPSAAKAPVGAVDWTGDGALEVLYSDKNGKLSYTTLGGDTARVHDAAGADVPVTAGVGIAASPGLAAPRIDDYAVSNPDARTVRVAFDSDTSLSTVGVDVEGPDPTTLTRSEFTESGDGPYRYVATYDAGADGDYTATLSAAVGPNGNDGATGQSGSVSISTPVPTVERASLTDGTDDDGVVRGGHVVRVSARVTDVAPENVSVTVHAGAFGAGTVSLAHAEGDTWRGRFTVDASDVPADGARAVEVLATNQYHNTATATSSTLVVDTAPPDADVGPDVTVAARTKTAFDADATTDLTEVVRYHWSFGDGASATGLTATHVYEAPGEYTVTLTATDTAGNSATATRVVTVTEATRATATPRPTRTPLATPTPRPTRTPRPTPVPEESTPLPRPTRDADTTVNTTVGDGRVDMSVSGVDAGAVLSLSVPADARTDAPGSLRRVVLSPTRGGAFTLGVRTDPASTARGPALAERRAVDPVRYWRVNHSISDTAVASASFAFTVPRERLDGASPDAVTLYRLQDGRWQGYDAQRVRAAGGRLHYRATVPGLSTFAVGIKQTDVAVVDTSLLTERVRAGETATVRATVENAGNASATRTLALRGGGDTLAERTVTLPPGERREVTFAVTPASAGTLDLSVAGVDAGTLTVAPADTATTDADSDGFGALAALLAVVATAAAAALGRSAPGE